MTRHIPLPLGVGGVKRISRTVAFYIWGKPWVEDLVRHEVQRQAEIGHKALQGHVIGYVGYMFGRLRSMHPSFLNSAIQYSQVAYNIMPPESEWKTRAMNNLAFYYSVRGYVTDAQEAVRLAKGLLQAYGEKGELAWITTYASVVAAYHGYFDHPRDALLDAERKMEELISREDVPPEEKQNASRHRDKIREALKQYG